MKKSEFRKSSEYAQAMKKNSDYHKGLEFCVFFDKMTEPQIRAMLTLLDDAEAKKLISCVSIGVSLLGTMVNRKYVRI